MPLKQMRMHQNSLQMTNRKPNRSKYNSMDTVNSDVTEIDSIRTKVTRPTFIPKRHYNKCHWSQSRGAHDGTSSHILLFTFNIEKSILIGQSQVAFPEWK
jgi:hypothetical protein